MFRYPATITLLAALLTACGPSTDRAGTAHAGDDTRTVSQAIERICGADRYQGPQGVDVSTYQPNFDWVARKNEGIKFGIVRVSNGTQIIDDQFDRNWPTMKENGILRGAYQYFRPGQNANDQAQIMIDKVGQLGPGDLPAVIDVETTDGESASTVAQKVRTWLEAVEDGTGKRPMIYTAAYFWRDNVGDTTFGDYPLWIANYGVDCPLVPEGWDTWTVWQYCDGNPDYCSNGTGFDRDVFNGTQAELEEFASGGIDWGARYVTQSFPLATETMTMVQGETVSGYIELVNTGEKTWNSNTLLATTEPRDRESPFADESWVAPNRPARATKEVPPGQAHRFEFNLRAPMQTGVYSEYFGVVQESVAWFSDPGQGGPPDDQLQVKIEVIPDDSGNNGETQPDAGNLDAGTERPDAGSASVDAGGVPPLVGPSPGLSGGCSSAAGGVPRLSPVLLWIVGLFWRRRQSSGN